MEWRKRERGRGRGRGKGKETSQSHWTKPLLCVEELGKAEEAEREVGIRVLTEVIVGGRGRRAAGADAVVGSVTQQEEDDARSSQLGSGEERRELVGVQCVWIGSVPQQVLCDLVVVVLDGQVQRCPAVFVAAARELDPVPVVGCKERLSPRQTPQREEGKERGGRRRG